MAMGLVGCPDEEASWILTWITERVGVGGVGR